MGKAEEAVAKRRNKAARKRLRRTSSISASLHAHIAAKRRRKDGKRRLCQGMCYTLPTPEDPFNDRCAGRGKKRKSDTREAKPSRNFEEDRDESAGEEGSEGDEQLVEEDQVEDENELVVQIRRAPNGPEICRELMVEKLRQAGGMKNMSSKATKFDRQFWKACSSGRDVIGTGDELSRLSYVAFAAYQIVKTNQREKPLVLVIVASQEEARAVRKICAPFCADLGIQTVSLHSGTPLEHQVEGLKLVSPEIVVATPERLCELHARTAIDMSGVTYLVVENVERLIPAKLPSSLLDVKQRINPAAQCVVLSEAFSLAAIKLTRQLVVEPVVRIEAGRSLKDKAACIAQEVSVIIDSAKRLQRLSNIVKSSGDNSTLVLIDKNEDVNQLVSSMLGVKTGVLVDMKESKLARNFSDGSLKMLVTTEEMLGLIDVSKVQCLVWYSFPPRIETYCDLLTRIARYSAHGAVYSFCSGSVAPLSSKVINVLQQCSQPVPSALDMLAKAAAAISQHSSRSQKKEIRGTIS